MKTPKSIEVPIKDLKVNLFVRNALNSEHAIYLGQLLEGGVTLPPISVTKDLVVVDGRHRIEAHTLNKRDKISCLVVNVDDDTDLIAEAYTANLGGSLPPTQEDSEHTVALLLERGVSKKRIGEILRLPPNLARTYIDNVQSRQARAKIVRAAESVTEGGLTVPAAAEKHQVDPDKLREALGGRRRRKRETGVTDMKRDLTSRYKSVGSKNGALLKNLLRKYDEGDVSERQVEGIFKDLERLQKQSTRVVADWKERFEAKRSNRTAPASKSA